MVTSSRKRVLLVEPSAVEANVFSAYAGLPLLGPLYLGAILRQAGFDVSVVSENLLDRRLGMADLDADFLLLSCLTATVERGYELAALFKRRNPGAKVLMGGPHVSFMTEEALRYADWVVTGEGEGVVVDLLRHGSSERVVTGSPLADLDALPPIDWALLRGGERLRVHGLMFSRGCPFGCNFCSVTSMFGRRYRTMSVERVLDELGRAPGDELFFYDDNFAANLHRTHAIVDGLLAMPRWKSRWVAQVRADLVRDEDLVEKMARAGCTRVYVGFESVDDRALAEMNKGQSAEDVRRAVERFHAHGIHVHGMFIFGADADEPRSLAETARFVQDARVDSVQYMILTPFPGTELFRRMEAEGRLLHQVWRYYDAMHVVFRPRAFAPAELQQMMVATYGEFYNLLRAANEGLETAVAAVLRLAGMAPRALGVPSLYNAGVKLMGRRIVRRWREANAEYLAYLSGLSSVAPG